MLGGAWWPDGSPLSGYEKVDGALDFARALGRASLDAHTVEPESRHPGGVRQAGNWSAASECPSLDGVQL